MKPLQKYPQTEKLRKRSNFLCMSHLQAGFPTSWPGQFASSGNPETNQPDHCNFFLPQEGEGGKIRIQAVEFT
jgi:hypothetical protein